jgi:hypothetical protein
MGEEIVATINPFIIKQKICIKKDKEQFCVEVPLNELQSAFPALANKYGIKHIFLNGNPSYLLKLKDEIINNKYDKQVLYVDIL